MEQVKINTLQKHPPMPMLTLSAIAILMACGYFFASDMYVPSMPDIAHYYHVDTSVVRMTISFFLISLAFSQLYYGPASDKYGRKGMIIIGSVVYLIGSIVCYSSESIQMLILGRVIQGAGVGALMSLSRTIIQDSANKKQFLNVMAWLSIFFLVAPAMAPVIGGFLQTYFGWRSTFVFMIVFVLILLAVIITFLPETNHYKNKDALKIKVIATNYLEIMKHGRFLMYCFVMVAALSGIIVFYTISPFIFIVDYHMSPSSYGLLSLGIVASALAGRIYMTLYAIKHYDADKILMIGVVFMFIGGIFMLGISLLGETPWLIMIGICIYTFGGGLVTPTSAAQALRLFPKIIGSVGAIYGFLQMGGLFLTSYIGASVEANSFSLAVILLFLSSISVVWMMLYFQQMKTKKTEQVLSQTP